MSRVSTLFPRLAMTCAASVLLTAPPAANPAVGLGLSFSFGGGGGVQTGLGLSPVS
jgi:hypothetical protein